MNEREKEKTYTMQKHDASSLHYDLRLEKEGVLKSWAIPKGPSETDKRLAIQTEDHDLDHAHFEGEIEGYGAGKVELWDEGTYETVEWEENKIVVDIHGERLNGKYVLIRFKPEEEPDNWLFFKKKSD